jgi:hypothetical protein
MNGVANGVYGGDLPNQINTPWIDFSEQSTIVGWSSFTTKRILYKQLGNIVFVSIILSGTSNSTTATFTLPFTPTAGTSAPISFTNDNGASTIGGYVAAQANTNIFLTRRPTSQSNINISTTWTASGTKEIVGNFFFLI